MLYCISLLLENTDDHSNLTLLTQTFFFFSLLLSQYYIGALNLLVDALSALFLYKANFIG